MSETRELHRPLQSGIKITSRRGGPLSTTYVGGAHSALWLLVTTGGRCSSPICMSWRASRRVEVMSSFGTL